MAVVVSVLSMNGTEELLGTMQEPARVTLYHHNFR